MFDLTLERSLHDQLSRGFSSEYLYLAIAVHPPDSGSPDPALLILDHELGARRSAAPDGGASCT